LLVLLAVTILFAGGSLLIKYKLEGLRAVVEYEVEARTGARLHVGDVRVNGLRGFRLENADVAFDSVAGPVLRLQAPIAYVYLNMTDLAYGHIGIDRIEIDNAAIRLHRPLDRSWLPTATSQDKTSTGLIGSSPFRVLGKNATLELENIVGETNLSAKAFDFDVSRLEGSPDVVAKLSGRLEKEKDFKLDLRLTSAEDFDLRLHCDEITAADLAAVFPASRQFVQSGSVSPSLRIAGYPDNVLVVAFEAPFAGVSVNSQPDFIEPARGQLTGVAQYDIARHILTLTTAKGESDQIDGKVDGSISFEEDYPRFDLRFDVVHLPLQDAMDYTMADRADAYGATRIAFREPHSLQMVLKGTSETPVMQLQGSIAGGEFEFKPKDKSYPAAKLHLGAMTLSWDSQAASPVGSFTVTDGTLTHTATGLTAQKVSGTLSLAKKKVIINPLNAEVTGNPFVGAIQYDYSTDRFEASANGTLSGLDKVVPESMAESLALSGSALFHCALTKQKKQYAIEAEVDATQAEIGWQWWFLKPAGVGALARKLHVEINPYSDVTISANTSVAGSHATIKATFNYAKSSRAWRAQNIEASATAIDVPALGRCLKVPYAVSGGAGKAASVKWARKDESWELSGSGDVDDLSLLPEGGEAPMHCRGIHVETHIANAPEPTGSLALTVEKATMPPLRAAWFAKAKMDEKQRQRYGGKSRNWTFTLKGKTVEVPPWKGEKFEGKAFVREADAGLDSFKANLAGGGAIAGSYRRWVRENRYEVALDWHDINSHYLLEQLHYPLVVSGAASGNFQYAMNKNDAKSLKGRGGFEMNDGQFSADFLISQIEGRLKKNQLTSLPPSLKFAHLKSDINIENETVKTENLELDSEGIKIKGNGSFALKGDMDYDFKVALSPDMAERIPALRDNLNIQGLRLAQQDLELAFKVSGPTLSPQSELTQSPSVGVTIVSSALELTNDAMRVIDIPRKVLVDLLRIGGGLVGVSK
jgi:hypothetical protein